MNAHSRFSRRSHDCTPTPRQYDVFRSMKFLHEAIPTFEELFGIDPQTIERPDQKPERPKPAPNDSCERGRTSAQIHNVAQPFLRQVPIAPRPATQDVTILELLAIDKPANVRIGGFRVQVVVETGKATVYKVGEGSRGFEITRSEICNKNKTNTHKVRGNLVDILIRAHGSLRKMFLEVMTEKSVTFGSSPERLDSLVAGQYVIAEDSDRSAVFLVTGEKREKYLQFFGTIRGSLGIRLGTQAKVRRIPNGVSESDRDADKLLIFLQNVYTSANS